MLTEQFRLLFPALAALLLLAVLVLYVHYTSDRRYRLKLLLAPALLAACAFAVPWIGTGLGYGWPAPLPASFQYLAHQTVVVHGQKRWVDVLLVAREPLERRARLHRIRWTREMEDLLRNAERMKDAPGGGQIAVTRPGEGTTRGDDPGYSLRRILPRDQVHKLPPPTANPSPGAPAPDVPALPPRPPGLLV